MPKVKNIFRKLDLAKVNKSDVELISNVNEFVDSNYGIIRFESETLAKKEVEKKASPKTETEPTSNLKISKSELNEGIRYSIPDPDTMEDLENQAESLFGQFGFNSFQDNSWSYFTTSLKSFADVLIEYINKSGMTNVEVYKRANLSKSVFSAIISKPDRIPKKNTVVALAIALKLNLADTERLLMKAGYTFSNTIVSDLVAVYFISKKIYDIDEVNYVLYQLRQPILGSKSY